MKTTMIAAAAVALVAGVAVVGGTSIASAQVQLTPSHAKIKNLIRSLWCTGAVGFNGFNPKKYIYIRNLTGKIIPAGRTIYWTVTGNTASKHSGRYTLRAAFPIGALLTLPTLRPISACRANVFA